MLERISDPEKMPEEKEFDRALRPKTLDDFVGQKQIKEILDISIKAAKLRNEPLDHILFYGFRRDCGEGKGRFYLDKYD